jgi:hypothetical protein
MTKPKPKDQLQKRGRKSDFRPGGRGADGPRYCDGPPLAYGYHPRAASEEQIRGALKTAAAELGVTTFTPRFLMSEWLNVVDAWQVPDAEAFQNVPRLGRKNRLGVKQRKTLWPVFERARSLLATQGLLTWPMLFGEVTKHFSARASPLPMQLSMKHRILVCLSYECWPPSCPQEPIGSFLRVISVNASSRSLSRGRRSALIFAVDHEP